MRLPAPVAAIISGASLHFAFPGWNYEVLVWVWLLPLLSVLWPVRHTAPPVRRPFLLGWLAGLAFFLPNTAWLRHSARVTHGALDHSWIGWGGELLGAAAVLGLSGFLALYFGLWSWFAARVAAPRPAKISHGTATESTVESLRCALLCAAAWCATEWLRGWVLTGFGWNGLGVALHKNWSLIQIADTVGVSGLAFLPVFIACVGWVNVQRLVRHWAGMSTVRARLDFTLALVLLLACALHGTWQLRKPSHPNDIPVRALLVQPNIAQVTRWTADSPALLEMYRQLDERTRLYAEERDGQAAIDLVAWPESAVPVPLDYNPDDLEFHRSFFDSVLGSGPFALITGADTMGENGGSHNSAILFQGGFDHHQRYHKTHLVPFGEYLPFREEIAFMETLFGDILPGDFRPGKVTEPLTFRTASEPPAEVQVIPLICFEDTVGRVARKFIRPAPQILANITNDGWFLQSDETEIHLANSIFRCIELRRPMLRAANTGVSAFIDDRGRVVSRLDDPVTGSSFIEGCLPGVMHAPVDAPITFYARYGDVFSLSCLALVSMLGAIHLARSRRERRAAVTPTA
jgi:apolipoprotein N-acyltransferase